MAFQTEYPFTLPRGFVDQEGNLHRNGVMRLATAKDEIIPLQDYRVQGNRAYLVITLPESHSKEFFDWHKSFVIDGQNGDNLEKGGTLEYLSSDLKTVLFTINFEHLGIFKISPDSVESGSENIRRVKVEMYCENMKFNYSSSSVWA